MVETVLNFKDVSLEQIAEELYASSNIGGFTIANCLDETFREELIKRIKNFKRANNNPFRGARRTQGEVTQEMELFYLEDIGEASIPDRLREMIGLLRLEYSDFCKELGRVSGFERQGLESVGLHHYKKGSIGITSHQDYATDINVIGSFVISGNAPFFICKDRMKSGAIELTSNPGSLILLRAARKDSEQDQRPFHYVDKVKKDRYSILVRWRTETGLTTRSKIVKEYIRDNKEEEEHPWAEHVVY